MGQKFRDVFPTLHMDEISEAYIDEMTVERVVTTKDHSLLKIYISSNVLIEKKYIYKMEKELVRQLFSAHLASFEVKILETFHLSEQYNLKYLWAEYLSSILLELKNYSPIMYAMLKDSEIEFVSQDTIKLTMEDISIYRQKSGQLKEILEKVICERCRVPAAFVMEYAEAKKGRFEEEDRILLEQKASEILKNSGRMSSKGMSDHTYVEGEDTAKAEQGENAAIGNNGDNTAINSEKKDTTQTETSNTGFPNSGASNAAGANTQATSSKTAKFSRGNGGYNKSNYSGKAGGFKRKPQKSDNPDVLKGYDIEGPITHIEDIQDEMGDVIIHGQARSVDIIHTKTGKNIYTLMMTDFTDTIVCKLFLSPEEEEPIKDELKKGAFFMIKGQTVYSTYDKDLTIMVRSIMKSHDTRVVRSDHSPKKRVELHCHTKMSDMDGVSDVIDIVKRAYKWGHPAIAITDHGVVQALADVFHTWQALYEGAVNDAAAKKETLDRQDFFKVICGCEIYLVDDLVQIVTGEKDQDLFGDFVVFDIETTGFSAQLDKIIEIGAVKVQGGKVTERFSEFVNPCQPIPFRIEKLTGISDGDVKDADTIDKVLPRFLEFCKGCVLVAHNAKFDTGFIKENAALQGITYDFTHVDTLPLSRVMLPSQAKHTLDAVCKTLNISLENHHRAIDDAGATADIFVEFIGRLQKRNIYRLSELNELGRQSDEVIAKLPSYHAIVLAKNDIGRVNLYKLVSESHLKYFNRRPKIPKSLIMENREGLILGSACEAGELYRAILSYRPDEEIADIVQFYDYLEIQPVGNNSFMVREQKEERVKTEDDIKEINQMICDLGEKFNKPVCATCDVHFLDPDDKIYRSIIMASKGFKDADEQGPLYLRTTEEMLEEFQYLGSDKAREVVIENTNLIADMCDSIDPVRPDKCAPVIENSDQILTDICHRRAHEIYGDDLPKVVSDRLERELNSIISNGFAVMYIIAQKLVWKSVEDGYLVGSRGSVGSSFVAYCAGITEVNSLSPHYYCPACHYSDFDSEDVKKYAGGAGCDMPDKKCPVCGEDMVKDGFDIPFETFLGFRGDKEPDIDLNFSGEYQSKAHKYTEVIFGYGQTFRAGTVGTVAEKTAFGYAYKYFEEREIHKRRSEMERLSEGCTGVRRSTGQHPGGIVVLPLGEDINSFTPVQHPANDMTTSTITTHFDYHKIDHNLLKLDILGHDDPTMIRRLQDLTGIDPVTIPLDDKNVMSLFQNTEALKIKPEDIGGCKLGALGIPEFGTDFAMQMLIDAQPKKFSDLVRISGLSHGTDVWLGNAQTLIMEGKATIETAICTRDDIMIYLIGMGMDEGDSFTIMEAVRKGKGLKPKWEDDMRAHGVPEWYIWSCKKIKYMFPKAHAAAYVMMAWRIAYCKIYQPLAFYAAYFGIRANAFSYEIMCQGKAHLESEMNALYKKKDDLAKVKQKLSSKEEDLIKDMRIVQEMYARGYEFMPIDIYRAHSRLFQIIDGKIMPSFSSIDGMGDKAAEMMMEAAKDGPFLSKDDIKARSKAPQAVLDKMQNLGLLGDIPESNQISLFDIFGKN